VLAAGYQPNSSQATATIAEVGATRPATPRPSSSHRADADGQHWPEAERFLEKYAMKQTIARRMFRNVMFPVSFAQEYLNLR
jgi:hypothetical protein